MNNNIWKSIGAVLAGILVGAVFSLGTDVVLHAAPLTFDASTFEIWGALLNGARLAILDEPKPSLAELGEALNQHQVTIAWLTAATA